MENATLVFIIIALGIVVVWQTSKLKQYERFEKMLPGQQPGTAGRQNDTGEASATDGADTAQAATSMSARTVAELADAQSAVHRATGEGASSSHGTGTGTGGQTADDNIEEAKRVQLVMARCHYADFYVDQLDDDYERDQFSQIVDDCIELSGRISDPFLQATALQPLILLMQRAGWDEKQALLMAEVRDDLVRQRIEKALEKEAAVPVST